MKIKLSCCLLLMLASFSALGSTKYIECTQSDDKAVVQTIKATVDDESDKAEVQLYATTAPCAKTESCATQIYKKETLPTILRLTSVTILPGLSHITVIDINRKNLGVVTQSSLKTKVGNSKTTHVGDCEVKTVDNSKNVL